MKDLYQRTIDYLRISVTDRCNLRCTYCMPEEGVAKIEHGDILSFDEILEVVQAGVKLGITHVKITGGEPLVRLGLPALLKDLKNTSGIKKVTMTTNGVLLPVFWKEIREANIDGITLSLDTLRPKRYFEITRGGNLEDVLKAVEILNKNTPTTFSRKINVVAIDQKEEELLELGELAKDGVFHVRYIEEMPSDAKQLFRKWTQEKMMKVFTKAWGEPEAVREVLGKGPATYVQFPRLKGSIGFISALSHNFCHECSRIRMTSEGDLKPCLMNPTGISIRKVLRRPHQEKEVIETLKRDIILKPSSYKEGDKGSIDQMSRIGG